MKNDVAQVPGLQRRGNTYYLRLRVPTELVEAYGKKEVTRTLKTQDYKEARTRCLQERMAFESEFDELRIKLKAANDEPDLLSKYSQHELERLAIRWFSETKEAESAKIPTHSEDGVSEDDIIADMELTAQIYDEEVKGTSQRPEHYGLTLAGNYLKSLGITYQNKSKSFQHLGHLMSRALAENAKQDLRRWKGKTYAPSDELFLTMQPSGNNNSPLPKKTLTELCDEYINDPEADRNSGTLKNYEIVFRALKEIIGPNRQIKEITREDCKKVRDLLMRIPANATKKAKGKSLQDAAKLAEKNEWPTLSAKTIKNYMGILVAILKYATTEKYINENPAQGLTYKKKDKTKGKKRYPFDTEQLNKIFQAPLYTGCQNDGPGYNKPGPNIYKGTRFWIPLIALFTGMRLNEICQLDLTDFTKKDGIDLLVVREENDEGEDTKQLKTETSIRQIPIHPELKKIGLMEYVERLRKQKETKLCPDLRQSKLGYHSDLMSKWFARFLINVGAKKPKTSFHSFRHNFRTALGNAELSHDVTVRLGGWSSDSVESKYLGELSPKVLYKGMRKVLYPELNLSYLYEGTKK